MSTPNAASVQPRPGGTRAEHLAWAKLRAAEYLDRGDAMQGWTSFVSDLHKHNQLNDHGGIELGTMLLLGGHMATVNEVRSHIEGCS